MNTRLKKSLKTLLISLLSAYLLVGIGLSVFQDQLIFRSGMGAPNLQAMNLPRLSEVYIHSRSPGDADLSLLSWYAPPIDPAMPTILYLHGNGGHIGLRPRMAGRFLELGWGLLMLEYRGYGNNPGQASPDGLVDDTVAAVEFLRKALGQEAHIHVYGESIGAAVAVQMINRHPEFHIKSLTMYAPFTKLSDVAKYHYWWLPVDLLLRREFNTVDTIGKIHVPVLITHGAFDGLIPLQMGQDVFDKANQPKTIWIEPNSNHFNLWENGGVDRAIEFMKAVEKASN